MLSQYYSIDGDTGQLFPPTYHWRPAWLITYDSVLYDREVLTRCMEEGGGGGGEKGESRHVKLEYKAQKYSLSSQPLSSLVLNISLVSRVISAMVQLYG